MIDITILAERPTCQARLVGACEQCGGDGFLPVGTHRQVCGASGDQSCSDIGCEICYPSETANEADVAACRCRHLIARAREFGLAGIPWRFAAACGGRPAAPAGSDRGGAMMYAAIVDALDGRLAELREGVLREEPQVLLAGKVGTGKTWLLCWLAWAATMAGKRARYLNGRNIHSARGEAGWDSWVQTMQSVDLLCLDELGYQRTDFERDMVSDLIAHRYDHGGLTVAATNLTRLQIAERFGESIADRLFCAFWVLPGDSLRGRP